MKHLHKVIIIGYRGKTDSVDISCDCGEKTIFAVWWDRLLAGIINNWIN